MNRLKRDIVSVFAAIVVAVMVFSCADNNYNPGNEVSAYETLDLWMKKYLPTIPKVEGKDGIYMKFTRNSSGNSKKPTDSSYVYISYDAKYLDGTYFANTDKERAYVLNAFSPVTRYVPFMFRMVNYGSYLGITRSHYEALKDMSIGDEVEMVIAPNEGYYYTDTMYMGFRGSSYIKAGYIAHVKMKLEYFVDNAEAIAKNNVSSYIGNDWLYVEEGLYMKKLVANTNEADSIRKDTTIKINYYGKFIDDGYSNMTRDGFVFDTNIAEVAEENNIYGYGSYTPREYSYNAYDSTAYSGWITAFKPVIAKMRLGEKVQFVAFPSLCYGASGKYSRSGTLIYTQTPLMFEFEVLKEEEKE